MRKITRREHESPWDHESKNVRDEYLRMMKKQRRKNTRKRKRRINLGRNV